MSDPLNDLTRGDQSRNQLYQELYNEALAENLPKLRYAIESSNHAEIRTVVHTLKPLFKIIGKDKLWEQANRIEVSIDTEADLDLIPNLTRELLSGLVV